MIGVVFSNFLVLGSPPRFVVRDFGHADELDDLHNAYCATVANGMLLNRRELGALGVMTLIADRIIARVRPCIGVATRKV